MTQNLLTLSPQEFETLAADIVGAIYGVHFERFGEGADGGMDGEVLLENLKDEYEMLFHKLHNAISVGFFLLLIF